jgi:sigma-B regulation protein RsbU (phosphoserine phosphatase)
MLIGEHARIAISRRHAEEPGGDFTIVALGGDGRVFCCLGDVAGHGARTSRYARELEELIRGLAAWLSPGALLAEANAHVEAGWPPNVFASAVCLSLDAERGWGSVAVAGVLPPLVRRTTTRALSTKSGSPLGVFSDQVYDETPFELADGDAMVLVTDGITDPLATDVDALGLDALIGLIDLAPTDLVGLSAGIHRAAEARGSSDDATVIAIGRSSWKVGHPMCSIAP